MENSSDDDNYTDDYDDEMCHKDTVVKVGAIAVPVFFSIVVFLSLFGNILVLVILGLFENLKSLTNMFIFNLALSDLIFTFGLPFWANYYIWGWKLGGVLCKFVNFVFSVGFYSSILFLLLMTIQRYVAVVHPLSEWETGQHFVVIPFITWAVSFVAALPTAVYSEVMVDPENATKLYCECDNKLIGITYQQNVFFVSAFVIMGFCYIRILQIVLKSRSRKRQRTMRLIFGIVAAFYLGWAPYNIVIFLQTLTFLQINPFADCDVTNHLEYANYACKVLAYSHCCLNPVFYVFVGVKFQNYLKMVYKKLFREQSTLNLSRPRNAPIQISQGSLY